MKESKKREIEVLMYFMPIASHNISITDNDIKKYFEWSERGLHKEDIKQSHFNDGFNALVNAKQWRGRMIHEVYEPAIEEEIVGGYHTLIDATVPRSVIDFMKKEFFKGKHASSIENVYQFALTNHL